MNTTNEQKDHPSKTLEFEMDEMEYDADHSKINNPYDPNKVDIVSSPMTIRLLLDRIENNEIDLNPDFQRKTGLWNESKKSRLIESILIKIPLPVFYFDSRDDEKWTIVDGLQRISSLNDFILKKNMVLSNLEYLDEYNGYSYEQLPRQMQRRIQECQIQTYCIRKGTPDDVTISIFKRINTGGLVLSLAEIRNCVFHGIAANLVRDMASKESFKIATRYKVSPIRMDDRDLVTRFIAFYVLGYEEYDGNMDKYLEDGLSMVKESFSNDRACQLLDIFDKSMSCCYKVFGDYCFRKKIKNSDRLKFGPINKSLFECVSCCIGMLDGNEQQLLIQNREDFFISYCELFDSSFYYSINSATGSVEHVKLRHKEFTSLLKTKIRSYQ